mgnify:CR=1 FL=1
MKGDKISNVVINKMQLKLPSLSANEGMARAAVAAFVSQLDPTAIEIADIKCAISEAVTNAIVHGYKNTQGYININVSLIEGRVAKIEIRDRGCGIENVKLARQPLYTTDRESERSGMGFTVMESFMDKVKVNSKVGRGTSVTLIKKLSSRGIT